MLCDIWHFKPVGDAESNSWTTTIALFYNIPTEMEILKSLFNSSFYMHNSLRKMVIHNSIPQIEQLANFIDIATTLFKPLF